MSEVTALTKDFNMGNVAAGNYTKTEVDGTQQAVGNATCWEDIAGSLIGRRLFSAVGSVDYNYTENSISFSPNGDIADNNDVVVWNYQKPHGAKENSEMRLHIHWEQMDATDREFTLRYRIQSNGQAKEAAWTEVVVSTNANNKYTYTSGTLNQITELAQIDLSGVGLSAVVQFRLTRSDAVSGAIDATFVDAHVEYDMRGSREEYVK